MNGWEKVLGVCGAVDQQMVRKKCRRWKRMENMRMKKEFEGPKDDKESER